MDCIERNKHWSAMFLNQGDNQQLLFLVTENKYTIRVGLVNVSVFNVVFISNMELVFSTGMPELPPPQFHSVYCKLIVIIYYHNSILWKTTTLVW